MFAVNFSGVVVATVSRETRESELRSALSEWLLNASPLDPRTETVRLALESESV
jgi:hypothetical protein